MLDAKEYAYIPISVHLRTVWNWKSYNIQSHSRTLFKHLVKVPEADQGTYERPIQAPSEYLIINRNQLTN